jgi:sulfate transport system ATP-binding protein
MGLTSIFVTHDQEEAMELADRVVVMNQARIEQVGTPADIHEAPVSPFVFEFLGPTNRIPVRIDQGQVWLDGKVVADEQQSASARTAVAYIRPYDVVVTDRAGPGDLVGRVEFIAMLGPRARVEVAWNGMTIEAELNATQVKRMALAPGQEVALRFNKLQCFPRSFEPGASALPVDATLDPLETPGRTPELTS